MNTDNTTTTTTGAAGEKPKPQEARYRIDPEAIPSALRKVVAERLGPEADVYPAKEGGSYKGKILHADDSHIVQAIGKGGKSAIVHSRDDIDIKGAQLIGRAVNGDLAERNVQVHYDKDGSAKMYSYSPEKEAEKRGAAAGERAQSFTDRLKETAREYAAEAIATPKARETFLKNFEAVVARAADRGRSQAQGEPERGQQAPSRDN